MAQTSRLASEYSAKIKRLYIELHNYSFFHRPSEIDHLDERFIGRDPIAAKLRTILTNHETKSGAYLVSGYRGAGKSSLVAQALSTITAGRARTGRMSRYFRIFAPLLPLSLIDVWKKTAEAQLWLIWLPAAVWLLCFFYLNRSDQRRQDLRLRESYWRSLLPCDWKGFLRLFFMEKDQAASHRFRRLAQDYFLLSIIQVSAITLFRIVEESVGGPPEFAFRLSTYLVSYALLVVGTSLVSAWKRKVRSSVDGKVQLVELAQHYLKRWLQYVNFSHRVPIKINLGHDELTEEDILRLIAQNIYVHYERFIRFAFTDLTWRVLRLLLLYFLVGTLYYLTPIYTLNCGLKESLAIPEIFPSQQFFLIPAESSRAAPEDGEAQEVESRQRGADRLAAAMVRALRNAEGEHRRFSVDDVRREVALAKGDLLAGNGDVSGEAVVPRYTPTGGSERLLEVIGLLDIFAQVTYHQIRTHVPIVRGIAESPINDIWQFYTPKRRAGGPDVTAAENVTGISPDFRLIPPLIDYFFVVYLILGWLFIRFLGRSRLVRIVSHGQVLAELKDLNEALVATIRERTDGQLSASPPGMKVRWGRRREKEQPIATVREIETRLIGVLDLIDRLPKLTVRPEFIFIFDELDKIEPHENVTLSLEKEEGPPSRPDASAKLVAGVEATRERQHRILGLLSNLKHFLTTAKAKFIFIAGREMFDAALADVSDRHFFLGSIFHDVIYVPSFLRDASDRKLADVTSLTERYVCQFLLPPDKPLRQCDLRAVNEYLRDEYFDDRIGSATERVRARQQRLKVLHELSNFIVYLTYRSNGAPKKLTALFEQYVCQMPRGGPKGSGDLVVGGSSRSLYLRFGFYDQYTFGLVTYLAMPVFLSLQRSIKDFGDKLLVSTAFLLDHVYKFHSKGFSWRNLELLPEIVDINRAPQLRNLIGEIISFLGTTHLEEILSGLYDFKFRKKIAEEIGFLSKVSERESAAFNFTLDESLSLKRFYREKLADLLTWRESGRMTLDFEGEARFVRSVSFVRMILGDLHFYDDEYDQAILEYLEAVEGLAEVPTEKRGIHWLVLSTRNLLKLGVAFEKKHTYDSAFVTYGQITEVMLGARGMTAKDLGLERVEPKVAERKRKGYGVQLREKREEEERLRKALESASFSPEVGAAVFKLATFEGIRLVYQPILAKLEVIEKASFGGLTVADVRRAEEEFSFAVRPTEKGEKYLVRAEFKNKVGDILYYKNGPMPEGLKDRQRIAKLEPRVQARKGGVAVIPGPRGDQGIYCTWRDRLCARNEDVVSAANAPPETTYLRPPCGACRKYMQGLSLLCEKSLGIIRVEELKNGRRRGPTYTREKNVLYLILELLDNKNLRSRHLVQTREIANTLSDVGDVFLGCATETGAQLRPEVLETCLDLILREAAGRRSRRLDEALKGEEFRKIEEAVLYFLCSYYFYLIAGETKSAAQQLTKILYVVREVVSLEKKKESHDPRDWTGVVERLESKLLMETIHCIVRGYEAVHRLEIEKFQEILEDEKHSRHEQDLVSLSRISVSREVREANIVFREILLKLGESRAGDWADVIGPYGQVNSMFNRVHELRFRASWNYHAFQKMGFGEWVEEAERNEQEGRPPSAGRLRWFLDRAGCQVKEVLSAEFCDGREAIEHLITDSIFCCRELLRCLEIYGLSFMANHSMRAAGHLKMAWWCRRYYAYIKECDLSRNAGEEGREGVIESRLSELIGLGDMETVSPGYHEERALVHYRRAHETHHEGRAYKEIRRGMYYLDDDLNDKLLHFCAALERYRLNGGQFEAKLNDPIDAAWGRVLKSGVYQHERHWRGPEPVDPLNW